MPYYLMSSLLKYFIFAILTLRLMTLVVSWSTRFIYISWCNSMPKVLWPDFPQITHNWYLTNRQHVEYHKSHNIDIKQIWPQSKILVTCETNTTTQQLDASNFCILEYFPSSTIRCFCVVKGNNKYHIIWRMQ